MESVNIQEPKEMKDQSTITIEDLEARKVQD
jgi:hypothetical protein